MKIDYVFAYVDPSDSQWYKDFVIASDKAHRAHDRNSVRYRDWNLLPFIFRCIEQNMPWINNIYMIVERESQVPKWINRDLVKIVFHNQIIPEEFLSTYNSNTIECFMHKIPGLSEYFIYGNDDTFPIGPSKPEDWFDENNNPKVNIKIAMQRPGNIYTHTLKTTENVINKLLNLPINNSIILRSGHSINPMKKSVWENGWTKMPNEFKTSITTFRAKHNISQEYCNYYSFLSKQYSPHNRVTRFFKFSMNIVTLMEILNDPKVQCLCVNDNGVMDFDTSKRQAYSFFSKRYKNKSKYEL